MGVPAEAGTAILFNNLVFHGSGSNNTPRVRWSLDWRYAPTVLASSPNDDGGGSRAAAEWWEETMSE